MPLETSFRYLNMSKLCSWPLDTSSDATAAGSRTPGMAIVIWSGFVELRISGLSVPFGSMRLLQDRDRRVQILLGDGLAGQRARVEHDLEAAAQIEAEAEAPLCHENAAADHQRHDDAQDQPVPTLLGHGSV